MIFSALYSTEKNVYFIHFKLREYYWLVIDKTISLYRHTPVGFIKEILNIDCDNRML